MQLFLLAVIVGPTVDLNDRYLQTLESIHPAALLVPFSQLHVDARQAELLLQESSLQLAGLEGVNRQIDMVQMDPENMMGSHIQALGYSISEEPPAESAAGEPAPAKVEQGASNEIEKIDPSLFKGKGVYFYCTHSAESYIPDSGKARMDGKRGLISRVASSMAEDLQKKGIKADYINTIHDYPNYNESYTNSRETIRKITGADDILAVFDVHRDSIPGTDRASTIEIDGKKSAQILIVVGTNERKPHPNWKENYRFAQRLYTHGEKMYPGLIKGVRTKAGTYNQEFHSRALLLEFGSDYNTLQEASYAACLFNTVLAEVLKEDL